jgi:2-C-methyl-D-erythritol 2,4-cyclodiphosphate synthase
VRIGQGFDVHALVPGRRLVLGGVDIPFERGLDGWSDADVLIHAVIDALFGAAALGDIGVHFPPGDPRYKDASSLVLLKAAVQELAAKGWRVGNIDATIVAENPRLSPHFEAMRANIARALEIEVAQVSVKANTGEGLGYVGRGEGMAAHAVALIERI